MKQMSVNMVVPFLGGDGSHYTSCRFCVFAKKPITPDFSRVIGLCGSEF